MLHVVVLLTEDTFVFSSSKTVLAAFMALELTVVSWAFVMRITGAESVVKSSSAVARCTLIRASWSLSVVAGLAGWVALVAGVSVLASTGAGPVAFLAVSVAIEVEVPLTDVVTNTGEERVVDVRDLVKVIIHVEFVHTSCHELGGS